jgi:polyisoprenoid-binding protein YceI
MPPRSPHKLLAAALVLAAAIPAQSLELNRLEPAASSFTFVFREMGVPVDGRFKQFSAQLDFDPAKPAAASARIDLDLASVDAGSDEANDEVVGKAWFDAKTYPQAHFESTAVRALGGNRYEVSGRIRIKGRSHEVAAPFTYTPQGQGGIFDGSFVLQRADFAIGEGVWADFGTVANEIQVHFHLQVAAAH